MPVHVVEKLNKIGRIERKLLADLGREPTLEELALETVDSRSTRSSTSSAPRRRRSRSRSRSATRTSPTFGDFLADQHSDRPEEVAEITLRREALRELLDALPYRERRVLELRYGLDGKSPRTLDEVGRAFSVTRERIRQIENQSLRKLQSLAAAAAPARRRVALGPPGSYDHWRVAGTTMDGASSSWIGARACGPVHAGGRHGAVLAIVEATPLPVGRGGARAGRERHGHRGAVRARAPDAGQLRCGDHPRADQLVTGI